MTKRFIAICLAALFVLPGISYAQEKTIPKVEFSVGGGFGIGGYVTTFPTSPWMDYVGQSELENNMLFYTPKTKLQPAGHAGLYVDFNFNEHWGLITGAEFGLYYTKYYSENMLNVKPLIVEMVNNYGGQLSGSEGKHEIWVGSNIANLQENHKMFAVQVPIMAKYMTPISKEKGHQYYVAAGVKLGIHVLSQYTQQWEGGEYVVFAQRGYPDPNDGNVMIQTNNGPAPKYPHVPATRIIPYHQYVHFEGPDPILEDAARDQGWTKIKANPIDVMASFDTGIRWNLGKGLGLYTGLFCDFGLLRPIARTKGEKVLDLDPTNVIYQPYLGREQYNNGWPSVSLLGAKTNSILAADAPDYCHHTEDNKPNATGTTMADTHIFEYNNSPFARMLDAMQAGVKVRFSFGRVKDKAPKEPRQPKEPKQPKQPKEPKVKPTPAPPTEVPKEIKQTMVELSDALFAFDKFDLNAEAIALLDKVTEWLKENPEIKVEIAGHTDSDGSDAYNQKLSEQRAKAVYNYFVQHGVAAERLSYKGYGESQPIATNNTPEGRQKNRRVELHIIQEPAAQ